VVCPNCKQEGNNTDSCFQLIGYPEWGENRPRMTSSGRGRGRKRGARGGQSKAGPPQANTTQTFGTDGGRASATDANRKGIVGFNDEQWATLLGMLSSHKVSTNERLMGKRNLLP
jgi:hypothetical protein